MGKVAVLVVAAGRGHRFGGELPKQYRTIDNRMILSRTLGVFCAHPAINYVRAVIHPDDLPLYKVASEGMPILDPVYGGPTRQDSVRLGLESLEKENPDIVLIQDGARPFTDFGIINKVLEAVSPTTGAIPGLPVTDTIKTIKIDGEKKIIEKTIDRSTLWRVQTPQGFTYKEILEAHKKCIGMELTDDAAVAETVGISTVIVPGSEDNFKITTTDDLSRAEQLIKSRLVSIRSATGFDVHQFEEGDFCTLCGVKVPHTAKLKGHSDADVGLHALTDALLGAIGSGDIGLHFPPSDMKWKNADSAIFLKHAVSLVKAIGGEIVNADITFICERPKIGAYRLQMVENLSKLLNISSNAISIKATTTEKLGFTGRSEGLAAQACVSVRI